MEMAEELQDMRKRGWCISRKIKGKWKYRVSRQKVGVYLSYFVPVRISSQKCERTLMGRMNQNDKILFNLICFFQKYMVIVSTYGRILVDYTSPVLDCYSFYLPPKGRI